MMESKRKFFDGLAQQWDSFERQPDVAEQQTLFVQLATEHRPERILDVGCGTGVLVPYLRHLCPEAAIVEMDFSNEMLAVNQIKHGQRQIEYRCEDFVHTDLQESSFDSILFFNVLPHLDSLDLALAKAALLLQPRGRVAVGHLMGSAELNAFHSSVNGPVCHDSLPLASQLADVTRRVGLTSLRCEERADWYFVMAEKA